MCFFLIYPALQRLALNFDGAGRMFLFASIVSLPFIFMNIKELLKDPLYDLLFILTVYMIVNGSLKGTSKNFWEWLYVIYPVILLTLSYCNAVIDFQKTVLYVAIALTAGVFMMVTLDSASMDVGLDGRLGNVFNANDIGLDASYALGSLLMIRKKDTWVKVFISIAVLICVVAVFKSACRTAVAAMLLFLVAILLRSSWKTPGKRLLYVIVFTFFLAAGLSLMKMTSLGQRVFSTTTQSDEANVTTGTAWDILGDRGMQYVEAGPVIAANPLTGIGLANWLKFSPRHMVFHSEFLVQLCENGLIGFIMYLSFLIALIVRIVRSRRWTLKWNVLFFDMLAIMISIIFTDFFFWTYDRLCIYCMFGILMARAYYMPPFKRYVMIP